MGTDYRASEISNLKTEYQKHEPKGVTMTPSEQREIEYENEKATAQMRQSLADFSVRVANGEAKQEEYDFMNRIADLVSEQQLKKVKAIARKGLASTSDLFSIL